MPQNSLYNTYRPRTQQRVQSRPFGGTADWTMTVPNLPLVPDNPNEEQTNTYNARNINYNAQLAQNAYNPLLSALMARMNAPSAQFTQPQYRSIPRSTLPGRVSNLATFRRHFSNAGIENPTYNAQKFVAGPQYASSQYYAAPSSSPNAQRTSYTAAGLPPGDFEGFADRLRKQQDIYRKEAGDRIGNRLSARGIYGSGIENDAMADLDKSLADKFTLSLGAEAQRLDERRSSYLANEAARKTAFDQGENRFLYNAMLDKAGIERDEAIRRTGFEQGENRFLTALQQTESGRQQDVLFKNAASSATSREQALARMINFANQETSGLQRNNDLLAALNEREFNNAREYENQGSLLNVKNDQLRRENITADLANFIAFFTGQPAGENNSNSLLRAMMSGQDTRRVAEIKREAELEKSRADYRSSLISNGVRAIPSMYNMGSSIYNALSNYNWGDNASSSIGAMGALSMQQG